MHESGLVFVQMRVPAVHLALGEATRRPNRTVDALVEAQVRPPAENIFRARAIVHGLDASELEELAGKLSARYTSKVQRDSNRLSYDVRPSDLPDGLFDTLLAFQASFGPVWMHFAQGRVTMRAQAIDCTPDECATRMRQALRLAQVRRQVKVVELRGPVLDVWRELKAWQEAEIPQVQASPDK